MSRSIDQIQNAINLGKSNTPALNALNSNSKVSIHGLITYIVASAIWLLEQMFNTHKQEVIQIIENERLGSFGWYINKVISFQYGFDLITDTDNFKNNNATPETIQASKIITHGAVVATPDQSGLIIKIATGETDLKPVSQEQLIAFTAYMDEVKIQGTRITIVNQNHDRLYLYIDVYVDPLLLNLEGTNILTGEKSVEKAIENYLKNALPFNGELTILALINVIEQVSGVVNLKILNVSTASINNSTNVYGVPVSIDVKHVPVSGYYKVFDFNNINYVV